MSFYFILVYVISRPLVSEVKWFLTEKEVQVFIPDYFSGFFFNGELFHDMIRANVSVFVFCPHVLSFGCSEETPEIFWV